MPRKKRPAKRERLERRSIPRGAARQPKRRARRPSTQRIARFEVPDRPLSAEEIEAIRSVRARVFDAYMDHLQERMLGMRGSGLAELIAHLSPEERPHLPWVMENRPQPSKLLVGDGTFLWRRYRRRYAIFGGARPFLLRREYEEREVDYVEQQIPMIFSRLGLDLEDVAPRGARAEVKRLFTRASEGESRRLNDLLLKDFWMVKDLLQPVPPPRPSEWPAISTQAHGPGFSAILGIGPAHIDVDLGSDPSEFGSAQRATLLDIATDERLLRGWPGESAAWAPYHAMRLLGRMQAVETAEGLLMALDRVGEDDWISDFLIVRCLPDMGPAVAPLLWDLAKNRRRDVSIRGLATHGLALLAEAHPDSLIETIERMMSFVGQRPFLDRDRASVNGCAAFHLYNLAHDQADRIGADLLEAVSTALWDADEAGRIDQRMFDIEEAEDHRYFYDD